MQKFVLLLTDIPTTADFPHVAGKSVVELDNRSAGQLSEKETCCPKVFFLLFSSEQLKKVPRLISRTLQALRWCKKLSQAALND